MKYAYVIDNKVVREVEIQGSISELKSKYYLPITDSIADYNAETHYPIFTNYEIINGGVAKNYSILPLSVDDTFQKEVRKGYKIPNTSITIAIDDVDRIRWMEMLMLINEMLAKGTLLTTTKMKIKDINGVVYQVEAGKVKDAIVGMGYHYYNLWLNKEV
jgi:hypothetical protein